MDPTTQRILLGSSASGDVYWINQYAPSYGIDCINKNVCVDSNKNVYAFGYANPSGSGGNFTDIHVVKYTPSGTTEYQKRFFTAYSEFARGGTTDSSGNLYLAGTISTPNDGFLIKANSAGSITFAKTPGQYPNFYGSTSVGVDSSGNIYLGGAGYTGSETTVYISKYDSSGTRQWDYAYRRYSYTLSYGAIVVRPDNNIVYAGTWSNPDVGIQTFYVGVVDSSGAPQAAQSVYNPSVSIGSTTYGGLATDSSNNIYLTSIYSTSPNQAILVKLNSNLTSVTWAVGFSQAYYIRGYFVSTDSQGNVYMYGAHSNGSKGLVFVAKFNSSGTLQWQRYFDYSGSPLLPGGIAIDSSDNLIVHMYISGTLMATWRLPSDGSKTGTYGNWTYAASSFSPVTYSLSLTNSGISSFGRTLVDGGYSYSTANTSIPITTTTL